MEDSAEASAEKSQEDVQAANDIIKMWKLYKQSHPEANIEDLFKQDLVPNGGERR
jgi:hypothetical protein